MLVVVAMAALAATVYTLVAAFGYYAISVGGERLSVADLSTRAVALGTLFLGTTTALLTLATRAAVAETRDEARTEHSMARAHLDLAFDQALPVLWAEDLHYVRVMVVNRGPAMARHMVVTLERIEPHNPMLQAQYPVPNSVPRNGVNVLPSQLEWKGHDIRRDVECDVNPESREYFDLLRYDWEGNSPWAVFWIREWREAFGLGSDFIGGQPRSPLVMNTEYILTISASAENADRVERRFRFRAVPNEPHFDFSAV